MIIANEVARAHVDVLAQFDNSLCSTVPYSLHRTAWEADVGRCNPILKGQEHQI
jgi:hypothetical protein